MKAMQEQPSPGVEIARLITLGVLRYPTSEKYQLSLMGGIASCLATLAVHCFGRERAPAEISRLINAALMGVNKAKDEQERRKES